MASYLRSTAASDELDVVTSSLEDAEVADAAFDLAVAATSFHWVDQEVGLSKLGHALKPGGWVALWWTLSAIPISLTSSARPLSTCWGRQPEAPLTTQVVPHSSSTSHTDGVT